MPKAEKKPADYILPLYMNGLAGRMLRMPAPKRKKREILYIYGHHTSIERMLGMAEFLNRYGAVTIPDLPGFGGMESFYKIGKKPTIENMADYLASFIKLRYRNKRLTIAGMSYGFLVVTRMLQKYPQLAKKVDLVISVVGFVSKDDIRFKKRNVYLIRVVSPILSTRLSSLFVSNFALRSPFIKAAYKVVEDSNPKMKDADDEERKRRIEFEIHLWKVNDVRTYFYAGSEIFRVDLCNVRVDLPVYHIAVDEDRYFNNVLVEQHMRTIFNDFILMKAHVNTHTTSVIGTANDAAPYITPQMRRLLNKKP